MKARVTHAPTHFATMDTVMHDAGGNDNATPDPLMEEPVSPPPREWAAGGFPGDDVSDTLSESTVGNHLWQELWRVVPHRAARKELPFLGFPSPGEHQVWYDNEKDALEAAKQLAVHLRDKRTGDVERSCGPALFVAVCGPFSSKKLAGRAVSAARAIDRSIRYEASCVVTDTRSREPHVVVRTPVQGSHESFADRFPGGVIPWNQIADDMARRGGTFTENGLQIEDAPDDVERTSRAPGNIRLQIGKDRADRNLRTTTEKTAEDPKHAERREQGRRILVSGRAAAASAGMSR